MKKYFPIRIFSIRFGYGWWWGTYFFFFGKHTTAFAIMPMSAHHGSCTYENGKDCPYFKTAVANFFFFHFQLKRKS